MKEFNFINDLQKGEEKEGLVINYLCEIRDMTLVERKKNKDYDFKLKGIDGLETYELKTDELTQTTNNIAIEFKCNNKQSGINTTKSDYYSFLLINCLKKYDFNLLIFKTERLKTLLEINSEGFNKFSKKFGGEKNRSEFLLVPYEILLPFCYRSYIIKGI